MLIGILIGWLGFNVAFAFAWSAFRRQDREQLVLSIFDGRHI